MTDRPLALSTIPPAPPAEANYGVAANKADAKPVPAQDIIAAAERIQDMTWTMRERGVDSATCAQIEELARIVLSASSLRDPADRRAQKLGVVLRYLEQRIEAMLAGGGANAAEAPAPVDVVPEPDAAPACEVAPDVIAEIESELFESAPGPTGPAPAIEPPQGPPTRPTSQRQAGDPLAALRAMSDEERIALFT